MRERCLENENAIVDVTQIELDDTLDSHYIKSLVPCMRNLGHCGGGGLYIPNCTK